MSPEKGWFLAGVDNPWHTVSASSYHHIQRVDVNDDGIDLPFVSVSSGQRYFLAGLCVLRLPRPFAGNSARVTWRVLVCDMDVSTKVADEKRGHEKRVPDTWRRMHVVLAYVKPLYRGARPSWTRRFSWMGIAWIDDGTNSGFLWEYKRNWTGMRRYVNEIYRRIIDWMFTGMKWFQIDGFYRLGYCWKIILKVYVIFIGTIQI